jgi:hypothetical protein
MAIHKTQLPPRRHSDPSCPRTACSFIVGPSGPEWTARNESDEDKPAEQRRLQVGVEGGAVFTASNTIRVGTVQCHVTAMPMQMPPVPFGATLDLIEGMGPGRPRSARVSLCHPGWWF